MLDSLLLASLVYFMMLIVLRLNSLYYVLPAYAFALPALGMFLGRIKKRRLLPGTLGILCLSVLLLNSLPTALHNYRHSGARPAIARYQTLSDGDACRPEPVTYRQR